MPRAADRQYFAIALGWTALAADVVIIAQFVARFEAFWTFRWIISTVFTFGLFGAGVGLLNLGGSRRSTRGVLTVFGVAFVLADLVLYCLWGYQQSAGALALEQYSGFLVLFVLLVSVGAGCIAALSKEYLRFPSYGFGVVDALYLFRLIQKYVFGDAPFEWQTLLGEVVVLGLGGLLFLVLFFSSEEGEGAREA